MRFGFKLRSAEHSMHACNAMHSNAGIEAADRATKAMILYIKKQPKAKHNARLIE